MKIQCSRTRRAILLVKAFQFHFALICRLLLRFCSSVQALAKPHNQFFKNKDEVDKLLDRQETLKLQAEAQRVFEETVGL
jgi:cell division protein FtsB